MVHLIREFCANSSIHGLQYWFDRERHWSERAAWIATFALSVLACVGLIYSMWLKWVDQPVLVSLNHERLPIPAVPFPAMTICPLAKSRADIFDYTSAYRRMAKMDGNKTQALNQTEFHFMRAACQICDESYNSEIRTFFPEQFTDNSILSTIAEMAPPFNDTMILCINNNGSFSGCSNYLFPIYTEAGLCYTYNSLNVNDILTDEVAPALKNLLSAEKSSKWSLENGYDDRNGTETYPYRSMNLAKFVGIRIYLKILNRNFDYLCSGSFDGYLISLHLPNEMPSIRKNVFHLSANQDGIFSITPNLFATSPELRGYDPHLRQCYFDSEHKLRFYRQYTQNNCKMECLVNFTLSRCGCVHFAMPRSSDMRICGVQKLDCMMQAESDLSTTGAADACDCLPHCNTLSYNIGFGQNQYVLSETYFTKNIPHVGLKNSTFGSVRILFAIDYVTVLKRIEFRSTADFLAGSGGLFGLFIGASFLSVFEFIYFFIIRICQSRHRTETESLPVGTSTLVPMKITMKSKYNYLMSRNVTDVTHSSHSK